MEGKNFKSVNLEGMKNLESQEINHPLFKNPLCGHVFLKESLNIKGSEIGIHRLEAHQSMPYYHVHQKHEETYIFYSGRGEFKIDGKIIPIREGTIIHVEPKGVRTWRNTGEESLFYICVQSSVEHEIMSDMKDGKAFSKEVVW